MAFDPINHVAAVTRPRSAYLVLVDVGLVRHHGHAVADVGEDLAAPIAGNLSHELLTIAGGIRGRPIKWRERGSPLRRNSPRYETSEGFFARNGLGFA